MKILKLVNPTITLISLFLVSIGVLIIYSSSPELAFQQALFSLFGLILFFLVSQVDFRIFLGFIKPAYLLIILLLFIVFIFGVETRGSLRWIQIGVFNIQPSEFAKPVLILLLAYFWSKKPPTLVNIFKSLMWMFPIFFLIFRQPDLGSALTIGAIWAGLLFGAKISFKKTAIMILITLITIPLSWTFLHDYQKQRIISFIDPQSDPLGRGYNLIQSTIAVGSGQFLGMGLGRGTQSRLQFLPEFRTDFIFASMAEELGFLGAALVILLYLSLLIYCLKLADRMKDPVCYLVVLGVVSFILFQACVNIGMNIGLLPITGITLPLISYGGSSLIATFLSLGLISSAWKFNKQSLKTSFER